MDNRTRLWETASTAKGPADQVPTWPRIDPGATLLPSYCHPTHRRTCGKPGLTNVAAWSKAEQLGRNVPSESGEGLGAGRVPARKGHVVRHRRGPKDRGTQEGEQGDRRPGSAPGRGAGREAGRVRRWRRGGPRLRSTGPKPVPGRRPAAGPDVVRGACRPGRRHRVHR